MSASTVLLTGMILLANYRIHMQAAHPIGGRDAVLGIAILATAALSLGSITFCVNAIASRRTTRSQHKGEIPNRFLFNWGDTRKKVDGFSSFSTRVKALGHEAILDSAVAELWTCVLQQESRSDNLRGGINLFRYGALGFMVVTSLTLWILS